MTVLAGVNGAGKSSVLEALSVAAGGWFLGFQSISLRNLRSEDIRLTRQDFSHPTVEPQFPCRVEAEGEVQGAVSWARELRSKGGKTTFGEAIDLPVIGYYGTGRLWVQRRATSPVGHGPESRTIAYHDCLDPASNQRRFEDWMQRQEWAGYSDSRSTLLRRGRQTECLVLRRLRRGNDA